MSDSVLDNIKSGKGLDPIPVDASTITSDGLYRENRSGSRYENCSLDSDKGK